MDLGLAGKIALVTGSSRGIGCTIAKTLHREGCCLALNGRSDAALGNTALALGERCSIHVADVTRPEDCRKLIAAVMQRWGRLDILVCNVGSGDSVPPGHENAAEWHRVLALNLLSATNMVEAARPYLRPSHGTIVCISSICGLQTLGAPVTYSGAKAALNAYVRGMARPLGGEGIRIVAVAPGNVFFQGGTWDKKLHNDRAAVTAMLDSQVALKRFGTPEEVGDIVAFLASPRAAFITGTIIVADGGQICT